MPLIGVSEVWHKNVFKKNNTKPQPKKVAFKKSKAEVLTVKYRAWIQSLTICSTIWAARRHLTTIADDLYISGTVLITCHSSPWLSSNPCCLLCFSVRFVFCCCSSLEVGDKHTAPCCKQKGSLLTIYQKVQRKQNIFYVCLLENPGDIFHNWNRTNSNTLRFHIHPALKWLLLSESFNKLPSL